MSVPAVSIAKSAVLATVSPLSFSATLKRIIADFQRREGKFLTETMQHICDEGMHFYGIHKKDQMVGSDVARTVRRYEEIKSHLLAEMKLPANTPFIQIVGDSVAYSAAGTARVRQFLDAHLPSEAVWIYGYTGHVEEDGTLCVNAAVSALAEERQHLHQTIGNLVGFHTSAALENWRCTGPKLSHNIVVYGDNESTKETGTLFGADITTSDFLSDRLLMAEGGAQSFRQACNMLLLGCPILALRGLKTDKTSFAIVDGQPKYYFNAPEFLSFLKDKVRGVVVTDELLESWYAEYFKDRLLSDPKRGDSMTKPALLIEGLKLFKERKLYEKLDLFQLEPSGLRS